MLETIIFAGPISKPQKPIRPGSSFLTISEKVNAFLEGNRAKIIDIKFSAMDSGDKYSAAVMIVYEREKYEGES